MKTSNKFILGAFLVFVIALMAYNMTLKAEYKTGNYKQPYHDYITYNIKDFNEIEVNGASMMHVTIRQGDFAVRKSKYSHDSLKITRIGNRLMIGIHLANLPSYQPGVREAKTLGGYDEIIITCPKLNLLKTNSYHDVVNNKPLEITNVPSFTEFNPNSVVVQNFKLDSLSILQNEGIVDLKTNTIGVLNATANRDSYFIMYKDNKINRANLIFNGNSSLKMDSFDIAQLDCTAADSTHINIPGGALKHLINKK